jgi:hypothetical protein
VNALYPRMRPQRVAEGRRQSLLLRRVNNARIRKFRNCPARGPPTIPVKTRTRS